MLAPTKCPKCQNDFVVKKQINELFYSCKNKDHIISFIIDPITLNMKFFTIAISIDPLIRVGWDFILNEVQIAEGDLSHIVSTNNNKFIPFFIPDLSNYDTLIDKLKTYACFN